jgi:hypothetical protein
MPQVDADDDTIRRHVVWHYRYDPDRHERRNVTLAAFDHRNEYDQYVAARDEELRTAKAAGRAEADERISGTTLESGHRRRAQNQRLVSRAMARGVWPRVWDRDGPPEGATVVTVLVHTDQ